MQQANNYRVPVIHRTLQQKGTDTMEYGINLMKRYNPENPSTFEVTDRKPNRIQNGTETVNIDKVILAEDISLPVLKQVYVGPRKTTDSKRPENLQKNKSTLKSVQRQTQAKEEFTAVLIPLYNRIHRRNKVVSSLLLMKTTPSVKTLLHHDQHIYERFKSTNKNAFIELIGNGLLSEATWAKLYQF
jgi:hypothetical protein